ncbi:TPA: hypothetical protein ACGIK9_003277 [Acinetobacter baumannii]|uniref:hypothetical protein n=1 Tax=Acinetobacter baumannii TaxID=470 RepID=UPI00339070D2
MGSPNFYTNTQLLNVAACLDNSDYSDEDDSCLDSDLELIQDKRTEMEAFISNLPTLYWHNIELNNGYHDGFQVYIEENWKNFDAYVDQILSDWDKWNYFTDSQGYEVELQNCAYFRKNIKNLTRNELKRAINREAKELHNLLLEKAQELYLGEVLGKTWTSYVHYPIQSKKIS